MFLVGRQTKSLEFCGADIGIVFQIKVKTSTYPFISFNILDSCLFDNWYHEAHAYSKWR